MLYVRTLNSLVSLMVALALVCAGVVPVSAAPPSNDDFASATVITEPLPFTDALNTTEATTAPSDPYCIGNGKTVWYQFTPSVNMTLSADTFGSDYDSTLSAYVMTSEGLIQIACNDDYNSAQSKIRFAAAAGVTYYFMVGDYEMLPYGGNLVFHLDQIWPPANDNIESATIVTEPLPFRDEVNTLDATPAPNDPDCYGNGPTVWYQFTPSRAMTIAAHTFGSDYNTTLSVYTGSPGDLSLVDCNDDSRTQPPSSLVTFDAVAGQTYYFMAGGAYENWIDGGHLVFTVQEFQPLTVDVQIDPVGYIHRNGTATIRGTLTCSSPAFETDMGVTVQRRVGERVIAGTFELYIGECSGETPWQVTVLPESGSFRGGPVTVTVSGIAFDLVTFEGTEFQQSAPVQLRGKPLH